ncbi:hypothetical protein HD554DRAFT_2042954 [Boletus coccyginus]|nr:hypothetical protein HD554DRAFT_2042954 [Boletus coccyginus]
MSLTPFEDILALGKAPSANPAKVDAIKEVAELKIQLDGMSRSVPKDQDDLAGRLGNVVCQVAKALESSSHLVPTHEGTWHGHCPRGRPPLSYARGEHPLVLMAGHGGDPEMARGGTSRNWQHEQRRQHKLGWQKRQAQVIKSRFPWQNHQLSQRHPGPGSRVGRQAIHDLVAQREARVSVQCGSEVEARWWWMRKRTKRRTSSRSWLQSHRERQPARRQSHTTPRATRVSEVVGCAPECRVAPATCASGSRQNVGSSRERKRRKRIWRQVPAAKAKGKEKGHPRLGKNLASKLRLSYPDFFGFSPLPEPNSDHEDNNVMSHKKAKLSDPAWHTAIEMMKLALLTMQTKMHRMLGFLSELQAHAKVAKTYIGSQQLEIEEMKVLLEEF